MTEEFNEEVTTEEEVEETEATETETPSEEEAEAETTPAQEFLKDFKIKYDGEEVGYEDIDELVSDAQKGKNYQRMVDKVDSIKNDPAYQFIQNRMKDSGYTDSADFVKDLMVSEKTAELVKDGMDEEKARKYAEEMVKIPSADMKSKEIGEFIEWQQAKVNNGVFDESVDPENIPQEVIDAYEKGESLKEAYQDFLLKDIKFKTEQDTLKKLAENKEKSAGKLADGKGNSNKDMTVAQIDKLMGEMSSSERKSWIKANYSVADKAGYFG